MKTIYECSQSKAVKWGTVLCFVVVIGAICLEAWYMSANSNEWLVGLLVIILLILVLLSAFFLYPQYIISTDEGIGIHTLLHTIHIPYADIERIERAPENFMGNTNSIRLFGIGGVLGFVGFFRTKGFGTYRAFVTDRKKAFIVYRKKGLPIAFSVSEPDEFIPYYLLNTTNPETPETL